MELVDMDNETICSHECNLTTLTPSVIKIPVCPWLQLVKNVRCYTLFRNGDILYLVDVHS